MPHRKNGRREEKVEIEMSRPGEEGGPVALEEPVPPPRPMRVASEPKRSLKKRHSGTRNYFQRHARITWGVAASVLVIMVGIWAANSKFIKT